ncbi:hypothetical protein MSG28_011697 [Choristoneura fumiferana]|uniref:Uncharacterized protein n=1 Tax=Choristoneura fumiferana TaxID=7141 RepID=A0ACC0KMT2_CHOFU|nr:hypothetical protein MSG28_011697 [Choristoneura fumiferana]
MSNRSAAGLRRSAIVARIRLREEWSELKGPENHNQKSLKQIPEIIKKTQKPVRSASKVVAQKVKSTNNTQKSPTKKTKSVLKNVTNATQRKNPVSKNEMDTSMEVLRGMVALVDVGTETRALALRAALMALGATVVPAWSPLVTHLVWTQGGCRSTRAKARALACRVVSPLWVEACASCGRRVPESAFPAAARPSDLPSPRALRIMLKRAEAENVPLSQLFLNTNKQDEHKSNKKERSRLRISSGTEHDTSAETSTDQSTDQTDTSHDQSRDTTDPELRVNTLPRGGQCADPPLHPKSRRKLFTQKEAETVTSGDESDTPAAPKRMASAKLTQRERRDLARAERLARRLLDAATPARTQILSQATEAPRIVLTGMSRAERQIVQNAIKILNGRVQKQVNHHTTHVLLGSCQSSLNQIYPDNTGINPLNQTTQSHCSKIPSTNVPTQLPRCEIPKARTLNALLGAARGCRVLYARWVVDSLEVKKWLHHHGYEVAHLKKISQKARVERSALGRTCSEYAYDVFNGMRVQISPQTEQRDAAIQLLSLCGGVVQNGGDARDGGHRTADFDVCVGNGDGEVSSKWVFDSVAAGRMRTTRRYINTSAAG